ncbi:MAG: LysM peptidoglycan-binding domain-containing protein [Myxococcota bacterium]
MKKHARPALLLPLLFALVLGVNTTAAAAEKFPEPDSLRTTVAFWMRIYLEVTGDAGLLHDARRPGIVYETVDLEGVTGRRARQRKVDERRRYWRGALGRLGRGREPRNDDERAILRTFASDLGREPTARELRAASQRVRFQLGQRDKFRDGLIASGAYEDEMRAIFRDLGLPEDLAHLPHVESSFNLRAYSKYGAAGVWQFMRSTGRRYLTINYIIDERLDPIRATRAAAELLRDNYESLGNWPLAITAYNHGDSGMRRAKRRLGTADIAVIVERYHSRTFGFASRNFYAQFLAARRIVRSYPSYFGPLQRATPEAVDTVTFPFFADIDDLRDYLGLTPAVLKSFNPSLRPPVFRSGKRIPKDFTLRLPAGTLQPDPETWLASLPEEKRHLQQARSSYYQVRRGDTLGKIAENHRTRVSTLVAINNLPSRHRIYPGQVLQLPSDGRGARRPARLVRAANAAPRAAKKISQDQIQPAPDRPLPLDNTSPWRRIDGEWIIVDAGETLGHFADWLEIPTGRLRRINQISSRRPLRMGQRIRLDFSATSTQVFQQRRIEYHKGIEEDFFGSYRVAGTIDHTLRRGENLWVLSHDVYAVPIWLIHRYNPTSDLTRLNPGSKLKIPVVESN